MENTNDKLQEQLEHLLLICNDGIEGYRKAADKSKGIEFTTLFTDYVIQRTEYANELKAQIRQLGGDADNQTGGTLGTLHRLWIDIKYKLTNDEEHVALEACITGEKAAIASYDEVLQGDTLTPELRELLQDQRDGIERALIKAEQLLRVYS
ncbi:ferritin-like domain-containing protein [Mucilaginibacter paludis]|uniref:DUF2383 domain-containing protein n=1 Tax=Mucilaginibacter paludis DSM 18603 TaxID=714943 RepID=H1Y8S2_9SPHI|nr:PA2169 family four-helix-bundle protein [Mucilaginibacter paludis]EHQ26944.1 Conserved hypothetical protein CHP02284 [Mucilaginibacter paludis DSM 18603]